MEVVPSFVCPISGERFEDPVVTSDGHTYNRADIERWLRTRQTSPNTNLPLASAQLLHNHALRKAMEECMERDVQEGRVDPACLEITQQELGAGSFGRVWAGWLRLGRTGWRSIGSICRQQSRRQLKGSSGRTGMPRSTAAAACSSALASKAGGSAS